MGVSYLVDSEIKGYDDILKAGIEMKCCIIESDIIFAGETKSAWNSLRPNYPTYLLTR